MSGARKCLLVFSLLLSVACASKTVPLPDSAVAPAPRPAPSFKGVSIKGAEQGFKIALDAFKAENGDAALLLCRNVEERFPDTIWYKRALFLTERASIQLDRPSEAGAAMLRVRAEYAEMADYAVYLLAEYSFSKERYTEAAALYGVLIEKYPKSSLLMRAEFRRASALLESYAFLPAIDAFTGFLERYPRSDVAPEAGLGLGRALTAEAKLAEAVQEYQDVLVAYPGTASDPEAEKALADLAAGGVAVPEFTNDQLYERGKNLFRPTLYDKALDVFTKLLAKDPAPARRSDVMLRSGVALFNMNRRTDAAAVLEKMVKDYPSDPRAADALYWLGKSYSKLGDWDRGVKTFQKLLDRFPNSDWADDALFLTGNIHREAGDMKKALQSYARIGRDYPDSKYADSAAWWRAWSLYSAGDYRKAELTLRELIANYPRSFLVNQARYWQGRAAEKMGKPARASAYYERVLRSGSFTYYGYRAAERKGRLDSGITAEAIDDPAEGVDACKTILCADDLLSDFDLDEGPPVWTEETQRMLTAEPSFKKTLELMSLDMKKDAARELWTLQGTVPRRRGMLIGLSKAFFELGDYARSLQLVLKNYERYLDRPREGTPEDLWLLAYPQGYWESVLSYAKKYGQDPYFIAAIIREESQFSSEALSTAGARGLMQVMPSTGEWVAKRIKLAGFGREKLYESDTGINIGTWYISHLMKQFKGDPLLAAAAYNAGPDAVNGWIAKYGYTGERDAFVEAIPFSETRGYVKKVMRNYFEYKRIYGKTGVVADAVMRRND